MNFQATDASPSRSSADIVHKVPRDALVQGNLASPVQPRQIPDVVQSGDARRAGDLTKAHVTEAGAALLDHLGQERGGRSGAR